MHSALLVARREYLERVRSKAFRISTVIIPLAYVVVFAILWISSAQTTRQHIVVASNEPALAASVGEELSSLAENPPLVDVRSPAGEADLSALSLQVENKQVDGYLWLEVKPERSHPIVRFVSRASVDITNRGRMESAISRALVGQQLMKRGFPAGDVQDLLKDVDIDTYQLKDGKSVSSDAMKNFYGAYGMIILLYFTICFYGTNVGRSVVEEKTSRIFEVLLATTKAEYLMIGKLLGVSGAVMTQLAIWIGVFTVYAGSSLAASAGIHGFGSLGISPLQLVFFCLFFVLGFLLYSAISAGLGAAMSSEQEMNQFAMIIMLPLVLAYMLMFYVFQNPASTLSVLLSFFPLFTPILMCLRMAVQMPPLWQPVLSVVILLLSIMVVIWFASRVYRVGILMYGKRPNLHEMLRWMRYS